MPNDVLVVETVHTPCNSYCLILAKLQKEMQCITYV